MNSNSTTSTSTKASAEAISRRAYEIWEQEGRPDGCDLRHWLQAEQELSALQTESRSNGSQSTPQVTITTPRESQATIKTTADARPAQSARTTATKRTTATVGRAPTTAAVETAGAKRR